MKIGNFLHHGSFFFFLLVCFFFFAFGTILMRYSAVTTVFVEIADTGAHPDRYAIVQWTQGDAYLV